jgi:hypothetical protein
VLAAPCEPRAGAPASNGRVRWVTGAPTEADRITLSRTRHGCLNTVAGRAKRVGRAQLSRLAAECVRRVRREVREGRTTEREAGEAVARVERSRAELGVASVMRSEVADRRQRRLTREVWCSMNANVLEALAEGAGVSPAVARTAASDLRKGERTEGGDVVRVVRGYTFAPLGRDLYEAGHLMGCRETAVGGDPFKWNKQDRRMAFQGVGGEYDDMTAFPRARMAMMEAGRAQTEVFLAHKEEILDGIGRHLWAEVETRSERRARAKGVTSAFDMDSGIDAWKKKYGDPHGRTLRGLVIPLRGGGGFSVEGYHRALASGTKWMASRLGSMVKFIEKGAKTQRERRKAEKTAKSYVLQEAEAASRNAKIGWCRANGLDVADLQHDGIVVVGVDDTEEARERAAKGMARAASEACGYEVGVEASVC